MPNTVTNTFPMRILLVHREYAHDNAVGHAVTALAEELEKRDAELLVAENQLDAKAIVDSDPSVQCLLINWDVPEADNSAPAEVINHLRARDAAVPIFLMANRTSAAAVPVDIMQKADDFIWLLEDTPEFISGRIFSATDHYRDQILPPMFKALVDFSQVYEYSWHTPGHTGGTAFLKSPAGRAFFEFFGEELLRSDLSISVGELGSLLDHSGPIGDSEKYLARVFGSHRSYHVTNGSSTSNRVILMASVTRGQVCLCDRNCHKSAEHAMTMSGACPTYLMPSRNMYGIIGPIMPENLKPESIKKSIQDNALVKDNNAKPVHAIVTNSTYDGLCYKVSRVEELLGQSVDRLHFDEAWYGYARFNPMYRERHAMHGDAADHDASKPTVFCTQSTHKLLAALSQASMIHIRDGRNPIPHARFNESFMMHASTSPLYTIIASNDVSAAMMDGPGGQSLTSESIKEAVAFRRMMSRINAEFAAKKDWFFNCWQPDTVNVNGKQTVFHEAPEDFLASGPEGWVLRPNAAWHGFGNIEDDYCMLDPIKVSVLTPGMGLDGKLQDFGIPASILSSYLDTKGIVVEKTTDFTILFLFSIGITKGKWGTLANALLDFKTDFDKNSPLEHSLPGLAAAHGDFYGKVGVKGLRDLCEYMFKVVKEKKTTWNMAEGFSRLPSPDFSPVEAYEKLVLGEIESLTLDEMPGRTVATGVVPYPPGIPLLMPGENAGRADEPYLGYLKALEAFDTLCPGFGHDTHGVEVEDGKYRVLCIKK